VQKNAELCLQPDIADSSCLCRTLVKRKETEKRNISDYKYITQSRVMKRKIAIIHTKEKRKTKEKSSEKLH
jgi:hypothetical protein